MTDRDYEDIKQEDYDPSKIEEIELTKEQVFSMIENNNIIDGEKEINELIKTLDLLEENKKEIFIRMAKLTRYAYLCYIKEGFNKEESIQLVLKQNNLGGSI